MGHGLAIGAAFVALLLPHSGFAGILRHLASACVAVLFVLRAREGYLRRRPHWTAQSWRRYLIACSIPIAALVILAAMVAASDWGLAIAGETHSRRRQLWAIASLVFLLIGGGGLAVAIEWLAGGDPSRQFVWRPRNAPARRQMEM